MKKKSLGFNALMNGLKNVTSIIFPLITFPYVSKVLEVDNIGKYNFSYSVISYFILFAALGISTYAIREGSKYRNNKEKMTDFSSQLFSINIISTFITYTVLFLCLLVIPKFYGYRILLLIFSIQIIFRTFGVEWLLSIYEEYSFITIRSFIIQLISLILVFIFVKQPDDYILYAIITAFSDVLSNVLNFFKARKICHFEFTIKIDFKKHIGPILVIFGTSLATTIYVNADTTILGFLCNDHVVGLYSVAVKIYSVVKTFLSSVLIVSIPRLSDYYGNHDMEKYNELFSNIFNIMILFVIPSMVGLFMLSDEAVILISSRSYIEGAEALRILCLSLLVCMFGWLYNSCVLIPQKRENDVLKATIISAVLNLVLNFLLIPFFQQNAAAFTTLVSEFVSMLLCVYYSRGMVNLKIKKSIVTTSIIGSLGIIVCCILINNLQLSIIVNTLFSIFISVTIYFIIFFLLNKNMILKKFKK